MTRVLFIGEDPDEVDFNDPDLTPGLSAETIKAGIETALKDMRGRGWTAEPLMIPPDDGGVARVAATLTSGNYDAVVIGGGLRVPNKGVAVFEGVVNAVHAGGPKTIFAFNTKPEDSGDAVARALKL